MAAKKFRVNKGFRAEGRPFVRGQVIREKSWPNFGAMVRSGMLVEVNEDGNVQQA